MKTVIIVLVALVLVLAFLLLRPRLSRADPANPPVPSPAVNPKCLTQLFAISDLCPKEHPYTGDMTPDGQKYCCQ